MSEPFGYAQDKLKLRPPRVAAPSASLPLTTLPSLCSGQAGQAGQIPPRPACRATCRSPIRKSRQDAGATLGGRAPRHRGSAPTKQFQISKRPPQGMKRQGGADAPGRKSAFGRKEGASRRCLFVAAPSASLPSTSLRASGTSSAATHKDLGPSKTNRAGQAKSLSHDCASSCFKTKRADTGVRLYEHGKTISDFKFERLNQEGFLVRLRRTRNDERGKAAVKRHSPKRADTPVRPYEDEAEWCRKQIDERN